MVMRWILAIFLISTGIYLVLGKSAVHLAIRRIGFLAFTATGLISLIFSEFWTNLSIKLGVSSGTELLTYLIAFSFISYVITNYKWRKIQEEKITNLARQIALGEKTNK